MVLHSLKVRISITCGTVQALNRARFLTPLTLLSIDDLHMTHWKYTENKAAQYNKELVWPNDCQIIFCSETASRRKDWDLNPTDCPANTDCLSYTVLSEEYRQKK